MPFGRYRMQIHKRYDCKCRCYDDGNDEDEDAYQILCAIDCSGYIIEEGQRYHEHLIRIGKRW